MSYDRGTYQIKCVKAGGVTLTNYGQYVFAEDETIDLLADTTPDTLRANDYSTAQNMCKDTGFEIAQRIVAGEFQIAECREAQLDMNIGE